MLPYQSLMPAGAGTPRFENWVHWLMEGSGVDLCHACRLVPTPSCGLVQLIGGDKPQAPALHSPHPTIGTLLRPMATYK